MKGRYDPQQYTDRRNDGLCVHCGDEATSGPYCYRHRADNTRYGKLWTERFFGGTAVRLTPTVDLTDLRLLLKDHVPGYDNLLR